MAYCSETDVRAFYGSEFTNDWADKNLDDVADSGAVTYAIAVADDYIDNRLRASRYIVPLEQPTSTTAPIRIKYLSARLTGIILHQHWGLGSDQATRMKMIQEDCDKELDMIIAGRMLLSAKEVK